MDKSARAPIDNAERTGYLRALRGQAKSTCVPFWWHGRAENGEYKILRNGTACLVDTGVRKLAVTADHVLAQYLSDKRRDSNLVCQLGGSTVDLEARVVARDAGLDVATIEVSEVLVGPTGGFFHAPPVWPGPALTVGEVILCGGYPGKLRVERTTTADLPFQWFIGRATSVSAHNISLHLDFENMHTPLGEPGPLNNVIGGMSGGPVFRFVAEPIERLEQVGIIYQYHESYELMLARPVRAINPDGTLVPEDGAA